MSHCEENGKDRVIFLTESDSKPEDSTVSLGPAEPSRPGLITESGEINWSCPCLGGMPVGPCGIEFRTAFECFHYSESDPKGSECYEKFSDMQECLKRYPELYDDAEGEGQLPEGGFGGGGEKEESEETTEDRTDKEKDDTKEKPVEKEEAKDEKKSDSKQ